MTPDAAAKAREILGALQDINAHMGYQFTQPLMCACDRIAAALTEARASALEEAAKIADVYAIGGRGNVNSAVIGPAERVAAAIRRLGGE